MKTAIAIAAHPDDIEFMMAGTLLLLKTRGYEIHYLNLAKGNLGTTEVDEKTIKEIRLKEAQQSAAVMGAHFHPPFCNDLEIFYEEKTLRQLAAIIRDVRPSVVLTHSPEDYMEDHTNSCRLTVTAVFARGMRNFKTIPALEAGNYDCTIYHALPHVLTDSFGKPIVPSLFVNITSMMPTKMEALKAHQSQLAWLDTSQKLNSYLQAMEDISLKVGKMSGVFNYAEGWRRHQHVGFCAEDADPLMDLGEDYLVVEPKRSVMSNE
jgi:LmbE family N-acetylglucosaminyl deacetylase